MTTGDRSNGAKSRPSADPDQTASDADQTAADVDQTGSDADQTSADADQATSDRDRALSATDQAAADRDQDASDRDLASGPHDDASQKAHDISEKERQETAADRSATAVLRSETTAERFTTASRRDETARLRDLAAAARDRAAAERDRLTPHEVGDAVREQAAADRARAAKDRERAAADRKQAAIDRDHAQQVLLEAHIDELTGTYRRGMGNVALEAEISRARRSDGRLVLAFVDVDNLKQYNDREGHAAGDALLIDVVATIRPRLRAYDPVVRFGGDEFVCTLSEADPEDARHRFDEIQAALREGPHGCSVSVGFACLEPSDTLHDLLARADAALYEAKAGGRHR